MLSTSETTSSLSHDDANQLTSDPSALMERGSTPEFCPLDNANTETEQCTCYHEHPAHPPWESNLTTPQLDAIHTENMIGVIGRRGWGRLSPVDRLCYADDVDINAIRSKLRSKQNTKRELDEVSAQLQEVHLRFKCALLERKLEARLKEEHPKEWEE